MILDILTVLFFVLGFALILWMVRERRRDVLHYVAKSGRRGDVRDDRLDRVADQQLRQMIESGKSFTSIMAQANRNGRSASHATSQDRSS